MEKLKDLDTKTIVFIMLLYGLAGMGVGGGTATMFAPDHSLEIQQIQRDQERHQMQIDQLRSDNNSILIILAEIRADIRVLSGRMSQERPKDK